MIIHRAENGVDTSNPNFVHGHTGPAIWTDALGSYLDFEPKAKEILHKAWTDPVVYKKARAAGICIMSSWFFATEHSVNVQNLYGSRNFKGDDYPRWIEQRDALHEG